MSRRTAAARDAGSDPSRADRRSGESGQALLELALITPVLVILVMAIFQFAFVIESQMGLTNAVREAARRGAATSNPGPTWANLESWVAGELCGDQIPPCTGGLLAQNVQGFDGSKLWSDPPDVSICRYTILDGAGATVDQFRVQVDVKYKHPLFFGLMAFATDLTDGTSNGFWDLSASSQMRLENIDTADPGYFDPGLCP